jgi:hypothetical protein
VLAVRAGVIDFPGCSGARDVVDCVVCKSEKCHVFFAAQRA